MNDIDYTSFDSFYTGLMAKYDTFEQLARDKLWWEQNSIAQAPFFGTDGIGDAASGDFNAARDAVADFANDRCAGDYAALETMIDGLGAARLNLNGETRSDGTLGAGIGALVGDIHTGLASWKSESSELFTANYVDTIDSRKGNQVIAFERAMGGLEDAKLILVEIRKKAVEWVDDITVATRSYDPMAEGFWAGVDLLLTAVGFRAIQGVGNGMMGLLGASGKALPAASGLSVQKLLEYIGTAFGEQTEKIVAAEQLLIDRFGEYNAEETDSWIQYVCSKPVEPPPVYVHY